PAAVNAKIAEIVGYSQGNEVIRISPEQCAAIGAAVAGTDEELAELCDTLQSCKKTLLIVMLAEDLPPASVAEAYLKLHLLSHRLCRPHAINLQGIFGVLHNLAWT